MHLEEMDLAVLGDDEAAAERLEHVCRCSRCRSDAADYRWLQTQMAAALMAVAGAVSVPQPRWQAVRERMLARQGQAAAGWRLPAVAGIVVALCLTLSVSPCLSTAIASQTLLPRVVGVPAPVTADRPAEQPGWAATPTPGVASEAPEPSMMTPPPCVLPPTAPLAQSGRP